MLRKMRILMDICPLPEVLNSSMVSTDKQHAIQKMVDCVMKIQARSEANNWNSQFYAVPP
jgi:hypothetical protein